MSKELSTSECVESHVGMGNERSVLYEKGLQFKRSASYSLALQCFLGCLQDMKEDSNFPELPYCLHNIAEIYSTLGKFEKAIEFVQAEKLFYESALIQAGRCEANGLDLDHDIKQTELNDPRTSSDEAQLANEYEKLAQMCLKEKKIQLALEYAGKATQLRKKIYGDSHRITTKSLDQFTVIYAEMGKEQYSAAMEKFSNKEECEKSFKEIATTETTDENDYKRDGAGDFVNEEKVSDIKSEQDESGAGTQSQSIEEQSKDSVPQKTFILVYFLVTIVVSIVLTAVACYTLDTDLHSLHSYLLQRLRFYYYYYLNSSVRGIRYM